MKNQRVDLRRIKIINPLNDNLHWPPNEPNADELNILDPSYRILESGEVVKEGDEFYHDEDREWVPVERSVGHTAEDPSYTPHIKFRRKVNYGPSSKFHETPCTDLMCKDIAESKNLPHYEKYLTALQTCGFLEVCLNKYAYMFNSLQKAAEKTIEENLHLADGDNCTLIDLKRALEEAKFILDNSAKTL